MTQNKVLDFGHIWATPGETPELARRVHKSIEVNVNQLIEDENLRVMEAQGEGVHRLKVTVVVSLEQEDG